MKIIMVCSIFCLIASLAAKADDSAPPAASSPAASASAAPAKTIKTAKKKKKGTASAKSKLDKRPDGLVVEDLKVGTGHEAKLGSTITVHYRGTFMDGKEFDSSYSRNEPAKFPLEEGHLIKGWTEGIPGMKEGGKRKLTVPYPLAYGERGTPDGTIPPKKDLQFEVELIKVE